MRETTTSPLHHSVRLAFLVSLFFFSPLLLPGQECSPPESLEDPWNLQVQDLSSLEGGVGEPRLIRKDVASPAGDAPGELEINAHVHALFEAELSSFEEAVRAIEEQDDYLPRLEVSRVLCSSGQPRAYARVLQALEFRFLFFRRSYEYVLHYTLESGSGEPDSFRVWWILEERRDEDILTTDGSLYFQEVTVGGERYTYAAYAIHTVFGEERLGLRAALDRFGERDLFNGLTALGEEAARRQR